MTKKLKIAVILELNWPYKRHYEPFAGIQEYANENKEWEICISNFPEFELSQGTKFDGIIGRITKECMQAAKKQNIPMVNLWIDSPVAHELPLVQVDYHAAGKMAGQHLVTRGFRQLIHIGFNKVIASKDHYAGMQEITKEFEILSQSYTVRSDFAEKIQYWEKFIDLLNYIKNNWKLPTGIVVTSDELAHAVTTQLLRIGLRSPEDFAVIGTHNELQICNAVKPNLSSIEMSHRRSGYEAASMLNRILLNPSQTRQVARIPPKDLIVRGSTDAYAIQDPLITKALKFMILNLHQKISVPDIATHSGVGRQTLERRFRKLLERSVNDELIRLRISKMKRLLVNTNSNVSEISEIVGFGTTVNMNLMFKKHTGTTPIIYRRDHTSL